MKEEQEKVRMRGGQGLLLVACVYCKPRIVFNISNGF